MIGFMSCPIRRRVMVVRCHRCLGYGHIVKNSESVNELVNCCKCVEGGNQFAECTKTVRCFLCKEKKEAVLNHIAASGQCGVFRSALEETKMTVARTKKK